MTASAEAERARILIVEDEEPLLFSIAHNLKREGYEVLTAGRGDDALRLVRECHPDLIVLDIMLPGVDGIQVCRLLRRDLDTPILMLTALAGEGDRVAGLDTGADDYMAKPFGMRELQARIRALLRRAGRKGEGAAKSGGKSAAGDIEVDRYRREARRGGHLLKLKPKEFELLLFFVEHPGRVFTREQILDAVWGEDHIGGPRTIDVHVRWLRQKIEDDAGAPARLRTVRRSGYIFEG